MAREIQVKGSQFGKSPRALGAEFVETRVVRSENARGICLDFALQPELDGSATQF